MGENLLASGIFKNEETKPLFRQNNNELYLLQENDYDSFDDFIFSSFTILIAIIFFSVYVLVLQVLN